jgi:hypothetical protein
MNDLSALNSGIKSQLMIKIELAFNARITTGIVGGFNSISRTP